MLLPAPLKNYHMLAKITCYQPLISLLVATIQLWNAVLAPTPKSLRDNQSIHSIIRQRLQDLQCGNIALLMEGTKFNNNWTTSSPRPSTRTGNSAGQVAADTDNYHTTITRACTFNKVATISKDNISIVHWLYPEPVGRQQQRSHHKPNIQQLHLPGNICATIQCSAWNKGTGLQTDSIDTFIGLVKLNNITINQNLQQLFNIIYQGQIPNDARHFFTHTYLFCLHKDPKDASKLRPIGIPTAIRQIMATHIAQQWKDKFALHLLPYNFAVGIPNGMDFIIKSMHLSIKKKFNTPQQQNKLPTRSAIFVDLTNMFNAVSREEHFDVINADFPELSPLTSLFYAEEGNVLFKWKKRDGKT
jgi:hypothetical protein